MTENKAEKTSKPRRSRSIPYNAKKKSPPPPVIGSKLNLKERIFVQEYFANGFNGLRAAISAGYSERSARQQASELLTRPNIQEVLSQLEANRLKRLAINADWIIAETVDLYEKAKKSSSYGPAAKMLQMLGQEVGVFQEKKEVSHSVKIENLLESAAKDVEVIEGDWEMLGDQAESGGSSLGRGQEFSGMTDSSESEPEA